MSETTPVMNEAQSKALASEMRDIADGIDKPGILATIRAFVWKYFGAAFADTKGDKQAISLGRVAFAVWFTQATYQWQTLADGEDIKSSMLTVGIALLSFVTGTKVADVVRSWRKS